MNKTPRSTLSIQLAKFFAPIIIGLGGFALLGFFLEKSTWMTLWPLLIAYFFPPFGKETVIPLGVGISEKSITIPFFNLHISTGHIDPLLMALSVAFIDIVVALFLVWNYDLAKKIPFVGKFMILVEEKGKNMGQKYGWVKPLRFIGIVLFVMVPFQGSGGLVGSIVGRLVGMKPWSIFFAISVGAITGCLLIATFAHVFLVFAEINTMLTLALVAVIAAIIILYVVLKKQKKKREQGS